MKTTRIKQDMFHGTTDKVLEQIIEEFAKNAKNNWPEFLFTSNAKDAYDSALGNAERNGGNASIIHINNGYFPIRSVNSSSKEFFIQFKNIDVNFYKTGHALLYGGDGEIRIFKNEGMKYFESIYL